MYSVNYTAQNERGAYGIAYFEIGFEQERDAFINRMNTDHPTRTYSFDYVSESF